MRILFVKKWIEPIKCLALRKKEKDIGMIPDILSKNGAEWLCNAVKEYKNDNQVTYAKISTLRCARCFSSRYNPRDRASEDILEQKGSGGLSGPAGQATPENANRMLRVGLSFQSCPFPVSNR